MPSSSVEPQRSDALPSRKPSTCTFRTVKRLPVGACPRNSPVWVPERFIIVMSRVGVTIVSITSRSISLNDLPNCSQNQAGPLGPAGCPAAGSWSVKSASYLSSIGSDESRIRPNASRAACPPSAISVATSVPLSEPQRIVTPCLHLLTPGGRPGGSTGARDRPRARRWRFGRNSDGGNQDGRVARAGEVAEVAEPAGRAPRGDRRGRLRRLQRRPGAIEPARRHNRDRGDQLDRLLPLPAADAAGGRRAGRAAPRLRVAAPAPAQGAVRARHGDPGRSPAEDGELGRARRLLGRARRRPRDPDRV